MSDAANAEQSAEQPRGLSVREAAGQISGLLDDDGHFNPDPEKISRGHPDYDPDSDERTKPKDTRGRDDAADDASDSVDIEDDEDELAARDDRDEDTADDSDTDDDLAASADDDAQDNETDTDIKSMAELADALEVPFDEFKDSLQHTFNAAGEEVTVTLAELEKGYQKDADYRRSTAKLAEERQQAQTHFTARQQEFEQANHIMAAQFQHLEQMLAADMQSPEMAELRVSDPSEWTARNQEIGGRIQQLQAARQQAAHRYAQFTQQQLAQVSEYGKAELKKAIPDFGPEHNAKAKEAVMSLGLTEAEAKQIVDHRIIVGAIELADLRKEVAELRALKTSAADTVKRVKKDVPKLQKSTKSRAKSKSGIQRDKVARLRKRAQKTGRVEDAAKVIEQFI